MTMRENKEKEKQKLHQQCIGKSHYTMIRTSEEKILNYQIIIIIQVPNVNLEMDTPFSNTVSARYSGES
jgi:hypothetical protein